MNLASTVGSFETSVHVLSQKVNNAGIAWNDPKYLELRTNIAQIASDSKAVIEASNYVLNALSDFDLIALEV